MALQDSLVLLVNLAILGSLGSLVRVGILDILDPGYLGILERADGVVLQGLLDSLGIAGCQHPDIADILVVLDFPDIVGKVDSVGIPEILAHRVILEAAFPVSVAFLVTVDLAEHRDSVVILENPDSADIQGTRVILDDPDSADILEHPDSVALRAPQGIPVIQE